MIKLTLTILLLPTLLLAQSKDRTQEPGYAESQSKSSTELLTTFTHPTSEVRGVWFARDDMEGFSRDQLLQKLDALHHANFNTIMLDSWFQGYVPYAGSAFVPQYPKFASQPDDLLSFLIKESHARGLRVELWPSYGFYGYFTKDRTKDPSKGALLDAHPDLIAVDSDGNNFLHRTVGDFYSLCPSNPKSHQLLAQLYAEQVQRYPVQGLCLDRIRYPEENFCFCNYCKTHFKQDTGLDLKPFPAGSREAKTFLDWRRQQTAKAVATIRAAVLKVRPDLTLTAYVLNPMDMDTKAQGWDLWMKQGLLDAISVSMYGPDPEPTISRALQLLDNHPEKLICALNAELPAPNYTSNIQRARNHHTLGQYTWYTAPVLKSLDALENGPYSQPATSPLKSTSPDSP
ncbi:MAG TPA: family 10 glycosylhydrolase [Tepidisphaeraceae bacterium]|jgi:uncharacterized lipoprotein YddW (UPF0748 family)|nr:family 10 glycosylhydrolase [Tepidisphaeraceae bacterium]